MCEIQYYVHVDVVQYETEIRLPEDFYNSTRAKRQSPNEDIKDKIGILIADVSP